jgi:hypothetical protein
MRGSVPAGGSGRSDVTRDEVVEQVRRAFARGPVTTADLVDAALRSSARPAVIEVLRALPERRLFSPRELSLALSDLPVDG